MASNVEMHIDANGETLDNAKIEHGVTLDELGTETAGRNDPKRRKREFRGRQVQMMAISMAIGSGLLFDTGGNLYLDGPVSLVLGYVLVGSVMYAVMITLGEMVSFLPVPGGFFTIANRCLSPALGFACGWAYWFSQAMSFPAQIVASSNIISLWLPDTPKEIWVTLILLTCFLFNNFNVRRYGEIEYWFTVIKVTTIVGIIFAGFLLPMNASPNARLLGTDANGKPVVCSESVYPCVDSPDWRADSFKQYLMFGNAGRFLGLWNSCCQAIYSYIGVELIGIAADECERQRQVIPRAVRRVSYRVIFYYVGAVCVLGLNLASDDPILNLNLQTGREYSPFVLMFERAGIPALRHIINSCALIASISAANTELYVGSRTLHALAYEKQAPEIFKTKQRWEVPIYSLLLTAVFAILAYGAVAVSSADWFTFLTQLSTTGSVISWSLICATYLRFRLAVLSQPGMYTTIPKKAISPLQPYLAIYGFAMSSFIVIFQGFQVFWRGNSVWDWTDNSWGYTVCPWIALVLIIIVVFAYLIHDYFTREIRRWNWLIPNLSQIELHNGVARPILDDEKPNFINRILDAI